MSGAVHGVDSTAVIMPNRNEPAYESCFASTRWTQSGRFTVKKPAMPTAMMAMMTPTAMVNSGF